MEDDHEQSGERRQLDRSQGVPLRRTQGQLVQTRLERRHAHAKGFDVAAALELFLDRFPTRDAQLVLLRSWLYAADQAELTDRDDYERAIEHAIDVMSAAADASAAIAVLRRA